MTRCDASLAAELWMQKPGVLKLVAWLAEAEESAGQDNPTDYT